MDREYYEQEETQTIKGLRNDAEAMTDKYEEALSLLESKYKRDGNKKEVKEVESNWPVNQERRRQTVQLGKEAFKAI